MKIAFFTDEFPVLSETFILNQITGLINLGHDVEIFARQSLVVEKVHLDVDEYRLMEQTHYINMPANRVRRVLKAAHLIAVNFPGSPAPILKSLNFLKYGRRALSLELFYALVPFLGKRFDVIHCHFGPSGITGAQLREIGVEGKVVTTLYGYDMSEFISNMGGGVYSGLFRGGDLLLPVCDYFRGILAGLGCPKEKIVVHHLGVDVKKFRFAERRMRAGEPVRILTTGRLVEKKGHEYAIRAIAKLIRKKYDIAYTIVGSGPMRERLGKLVDELGIRDRVEFAGAVTHSELLSIYLKAHIFVLPSVTGSDGNKEGIPAVLLEAQSTGLPVVSTYHSGIPEAVIDRRTGLLVHEKDVDALAEKIKYLVEHPEVWPVMGRAGRRLVEEQYDIDRLNEQLVGIYRGLVGGR